MRRDSLARLQRISVVPFLHRTFFVGRNPPAPLRDEDSFGYSMAVVRRRASGWGIHLLLR
jgi:hypothetical protein